MKNTFLIFLSVSFLTTCYSWHYADWTNLTIPRIGTFQMPVECIVTQEDNTVYITDKPINEADCTIYMAGIIYESGRNDYLRPYNLFDDVTLIDQEIKGGKLYSNSASYDINEYIISGNIETKYIIQLRNFFESIEFIVWDNSFDEKTVQKICNTYLRVVLDEERELSKSKKK
jgi:hypothetical protein